ncbi:MAG: T9SS type A sorting domain-containing protein [Vicingaceae bacterium]
MSKGILTKRLKQYAALAASAIATDASAQIVYTDITDTTLVNNGDYFDISLNNDGTMEVRLTMTKSIFSYPSYSMYIKLDMAKVQPLNSADVNMSFSATSSYSSSFGVAMALSNNQTINNSLNTWSNTSAYVGGYADIRTSSTSYTTSVGQFPGAGDKYLGVKFTVGSNVHYGWVRLDMSSMSDSLTIKDYAYESKSNTPIAAGDTGLTVGVNKIKHTKQFDFYATEGRVVLKNKLEGATVLSVYDLSGKLIEERELNIGQTDVTMKQSLSGVYIVELRNGEGVRRKKLWLDTK